MPGYVMFLSGSAIGDASGTRTTGQPTSPNGASSIHLLYPATVAVELAATITVTSLATPPAIVFWALELDLIDSTGNSVALPHIGIQYHPQYPNSRAVNWGGYNVNTGAELNGTASTLPSALNNPNTRNYDWQTNRGYRLRVWTPTPGTWRGEITDTVTTVTTVIRDLSAPGATQLRGAVAFTEAFNTCQTSVAARWTNLQFKLANSTFSTPTTAVANYQSYADGGCTNTNNATSGGGIVQTTGVTRTTAQGATLSTT
jgi:hypothetical protein